MIEGLCIVIAFVLGAVFGKGITIRISNFPELKDEEFNTGYLADPKVKEYFDKKLGGDM